MGSNTNILILLLAITLCGADVLFKIKSDIYVGVLTLGSPIGCLISGYCMDILGRKKLLIYSHLPVCFGWCYIGFGKNAKDIIIGRVITGIGVGLAMCVPRVYTTEISLPNMRGVIGSFPNLATSLGITVQASIGSKFKWTTLCFVCAVYELILFSVNFFLPESPYFLLKSSTIEEAQKSLKKLRSKDYNIRAEINELIDFKRSNELCNLTFKEQVERMCTRAAYRPFCIIMIYIIITQMSGVTVVVMWAVEMLQMSKSSVDPHVGNIMLGITRLISGLFTTILIYRVGRRLLALISGVGVGFICVVLGTFIQYETHLTIFPQMFYIAYIIFAALGHYTLPVLVMFELYPLQIRGILGGVSISNIGFLISAVNVCYPHVRDLLGFANTITSFGICSLLGCIFLYFYLPETKGLTLQEIEEYFNDTRPTLTSQRRLISMQNLSRMPSISAMRKVKYDESRTHVK